MNYFFFYRIKYIDNEQFVLVFQQIEVISQGSFRLRKMLIVLFLLMLLIELLVVFLLMVVNLLVNVFGILVFRVMKVMVIIVFFRLIRYLKMFVRLDIRVVIKLINISDLINVRQFLVKDGGGMKVNKICKFEI